MFKCDPNGHQNLYPLNTNYEDFYHKKCWLDSIDKGMRIKYVLYLYYQTVSLS